MLIKQFQKTISLGPLNVNSGGKRERVNENANGHQPTAQAPAPWGCPKFASPTTWKGIPEIGI